MRVLTWVLLVALVSLAVWSGRPLVGFALAGAKALLVGAEFMELKHAARWHGATFGALVLLMVVLLGLLTRGSGAAP